MPDPPFAHSAFINQKWAEYQRLAINQGASDQEVSSARLIFYAGAMAVMHEAVKVYNHAPSKTMPIFLQDLSNELAEFQAEVVGEDDQPEVRIILPGDPQHPGVIHLREKP